MYGTQRNSISHIPLWQKIAQLNGRLRSAVVLFIDKKKSFRYNVVELRDRSGVDLADINPFRYRGYLYDYEFGLYYLQSRYYDPETCRFINPDSIESLTQYSDVLANLYAYCENNPINNTDISGNLTAQLVARIILGIMIGIIVQLVSDIIDIMIARILGADEKRPVGSEYLASALSWALTCVSVNKKSLQIVVALLPIAMKHIGLAITEQFDSRALAVDLIIAGLAIILSTNFDKTLIKKLRKLISKLSSNNTFKGVSKNVIKIALKRRVCGIKFNLSINITYAITSVIVSFLTKLKEKEEN